MNGFKTESGAVYEFNENGDRIRRVNPNHSKRADGEWVRIMGGSEIRIGERAVLILESLAPWGFDDYGTESPGPVTSRVTTPVVETW